MRRGLIEEATARKTFGEVPVASCEEDGLGRMGKTTKVGGQRVMDISLR
jgi:hypothetical protein